MNNYSAGPEQSNYFPVCFDTTTLQIPAVSDAAKHRVRVAESERSPPARSGRVLGVQVCTS